MARLVELANRRGQSVPTTISSFTSRINDHFSQPEKVALVEAMWQVAYADGFLNANENHVISKAAGLLHVTHGEYIAAKIACEGSGRPQLIGVRFQLIPG